MPLAYIHFEPCPKCSFQSTPAINITGKSEEGAMYRATCRICRYGQRDTYDSIEDCAKAWNKASNEAWGHILESRYAQLMQRFNNFS